MSKRDGFENLFPVPEGVEYNEAMGSYVFAGTTTEAPHDDLWLAYQEGASYYPDQLDKRYRKAWRSMMMTCTACFAVIVILNHFLSC